MNNLKRWLTFACAALLTCALCFSQTAPAFAADGATLKFDGGDVTSTVFPDKTGIAPTDTDLLPPLPQKEGYRAVWEIMGGALSNGLGFFTSPISGGVYVRTPVFSTDTFGDMATRADSAHAADITELYLKAFYAPIIGCQINYDTNGGTPATILPLKYLQSGDTNLFPVPAPTKPGFTLTGWQITGGSSLISGWPSPIEPFPQVMNPGGAPIDYPQVVGDSTMTLRELDAAAAAFWNPVGTAIMSLDLKAVWTPAQEPLGYTIRYNAYPSTTVIPNKTVASIDATGLAPTTIPVRAGYDFVGWWLSEVMPATGGSPMMFNYGPSTHLLTADDSVSTLSSANLSDGSELLMSAAWKISDETTGNPGSGETTGTPGSGETTGSAPTTSTVATPTAGIPKTGDVVRSIGPLVLWSAVAMGLAFFLRRFRVTPVSATK
ncbi:MAG: InlB B-repeat-containing protein [Actinomycetia bacterium]|nr:InlB B-repeat-containing protein [Actinomycetes bacterium]